MAFETIVSTLTLADALAHSGWVVIDCRFELAKPEQGFLDYQAGHIPGAVFADLNRDLAGSPNPATGRHPLPDPAEFVRKCAQWGITQDSQVVLYDQADGSFACRMWWMLRAVGHYGVALLDGGLQKWKSENRPLKLGVEERNSTLLPNLEPSFNPEFWLKSDEVVQQIGNPNFLLIDARTAIRYRGENEPIDPVAGHIPGAVNRFYGLNLNEDNTFKSPDLLRKEYLSLLGQVQPANTAVYCGSGVTSCHNLIAMEIAGIKGARLYAGSWSEWIRDPNRPRWTP